MRTPPVIPFAEGAVRGFLHEPAAPTGNKLVLTHGAGSNCRAPLVVAVAEAFCGAGYCVLRCDLAFRQRRPFGPPLPKSSDEDRACLSAAAAALRLRGPGPVFLGGHSYGGRQASILAAAEPESCAGLLLLSYPLHPPNKPNELRTAHFPKLQRPALFVHGAADPFGSIEEIRAALALIPSPAQLVAVERAGHDLARGKFDVQRLVVEKFAQLAR